MRETRIINRAIMATGLFIAFCLIADEMETLTTAQFVIAKAGGCLLAWALWSKARALHARNEI